MHHKPKIHTFGSPDDLARAGAERFMGLAMNAEQGLNVALPGGRIYKLFFAQLAEEARRHAGVLEKAHFFWGDERCVAPDDEESNFKLAEEGLLRPLGFPQDRIHRIPGEQQPSLAAHEAEREMRSVLRVPDGIPVLDLVLLGMGEDGHVASLFPGESAAEIQSPAVYRAVVGPKPPANRVTLGYKALWTAREVWVLISGAEKRGALMQSLAPNAVTPLGRVIAHRTETTIFTDCQL